MKYFLALNFLKLENVNPIFVSGVDNSGNYITTDLDSRLANCKIHLDIFSPQEEKAIWRLGNRRI